ncbi:hypothetical protein Q6247_25565, partial [Klebsiella pneumoniae]
ELPNSEKFQITNWDSSLHSSYQDDCDPYVDHLIWTNLHREKPDVLVLISEVLVFIGKIILE